MAEQKRCVHCERPIDQWSRVCPFCNADQLSPVRPATTTKSQAPAYVPPSERNVKRTLLIGLGVAAMLVAAFFVGMLINSDGAPDDAPETLAEQAQEQTTEKAPQQKRADTPLVPMGAGDIEQPITSAPVPTPAAGSLSEYERTDATAVSSLEYARLAQRAKTEQKTGTRMVDPRSLSGAAYAQGQTAPARPAARRPAPPARTSAPASASNAPAAEAPRRVAAVRTRPVPEYQPLPRIRASGTARLSLTVGPDGRVREVEIEKMLQGGNTAQLISSVRNWRFKPATENGEPVTAPYSVEITFN